jgi:predicted Zn-dependent protease
MTMDETTREEILSYVFRSLVRLQKYEDARALLAWMQERSYRSVFYLESFLIRLGGGNLNQAVKLLREARKVGKYKNSVVADLAICLKLLGRWSDLQTLLTEERKRVETNPVLLDIKIGMLVAAGDFSEAESQIAKLRSMPFDDGRADSRAATILMNRDRDFGKAYALLTSVLNRQTKGALGVRRLRALAGARGKRYDEARRDAEYLRARPGGADSYNRIEAEIKLSQGDYSGAISSLELVKSQTFQDHLLEARIVEAQGLDARTPLHQRDHLFIRSAEIRRQYKAADEYDFYD